MVRALSLTVRKSSRAVVGDNILQRILHEYSQASSKDISLHADIAFDARSNGGPNVAEIGALTKSAKRDSSDF